uniref:Aha1 domain protein n=1 Tax=uncultured bacterium esnapd2 TaxID=1366601 RepID=S5TTR1_9BACT|nr:Aha1 domain protein [uncultured bacterium esnapd2]
MVDILHRVGVTASPKEVYDALTTLDGLAGWWTRDTTGDSAVGGVIRFRFENAPPPSGFDMKVLATDPAERVLWEVVDGPGEWVGTRVRFDLKQEDEYTIVLFGHEGWAGVNEFMHHCSTKWAAFLMSLKKLVETGTGEPAPDDVRISNWH